MKIQLENIKKRFDDKTVLNNISLYIDEGQFVALLGPSGCGKTTLLNALAGLLNLDGGSITVGGRVWSKSGFTMAPEQRNVGMVFQDFALWPHMSVFENVAFGLKMKKTAAAQVKSRVSEVLELVQMGAYANHYPHQLSGGQKQRVAIARALAPNPTIMLMDEPLSSLDAKLREQMRWELLHLIRTAGITTVYVTHDQIEALSMADQVVLLNQGNIEQQGSPQELYQHPRTTFAATFVGASNLIVGRVKGREGQRLELECGSQSLIVSGTRDLGEEVTVMIRPSDISMGTPNEIEKRFGGIVSANLLYGTVTQRSFHGVTWQYKVSIENWSTLLEVWDSREWSLGNYVTVLLPVDKCLPVLTTDEQPVFQ